MPFARPTWQWWIFVTGLGLIVVRVTTTLILGDSNWWIGVLIGFAMMGQLAFDLGPKTQPPSEQETALKEQAEADNPAAALQL